MCEIICTTTKLEANQDELSVLEENKAIDSIKGGSEEEEQTEMQTNRICICGIPNSVIELD